VSRRATLVIPVYEAASFLKERLQHLLQGLDEVAAHLDWEILIVDDGSRDGSAALVTSTADERLRLLRLDRNRGKFAALRRGFAESTGDVVLFTDADIPYPLGAIPYFARLVGESGFDLATGDRTLTGNRHQAAASVGRLFGSSLFGWLVRIFVTGGIYDTQCGLKAFRGPVGRALFAAGREPGFAGDVEILYLALKHNLAIRRVPLAPVYHGRSSVSLRRHALPMALACLRMRYRLLRGDYALDELRRLAAQPDFNATQKGES
jgi:dolichyl-phosphate beta-glucosyltransferase